MAKDDFSKRMKPEDVVELQGDVETFISCLPAMPSLEREWIEKAAVKMLSYAYLKGYQCALDRKLSAYEAYQVR